MHGTPRSVVTRLALWAIRLYQRHLSPHKGFCCAWRVATGGDSCSAYGHRVIARHGLGLGWQLSRRQLRRCGEVHRARAVRVTGVPNPLLRHQRGECDPGCSVLECACDIFGKDDWRRWREYRRRKRAERQRRGR